MSLSYKPKAYTNSVITYLSVNNALEAISFYEKAFGAEKISVSMDSKGVKVMHSAIKINDTILFIHDPVGEENSPNTTSLYVYVPDADAAFNRAVENGCTIKMAIGDQFWGDRMGLLADPYGSKWGIATRIKDLSEEELKVARDEFMKKWASQHRDGHGSTA